MPPLMVSVWDTQTRLSIAACRAPGGNEVAATLARLKTLTLKGCIVTADASHCHPAMAEAVQATGADYVLGLKGNHGPLHAAAIEAFAQADAQGGPAFKETTERGHDREEWRCASVTAPPGNAPAFPGLAAIGRIEAERRCHDKTETSTRYIALSRDLSPARLIGVNTDRSIAVRPPQPCAARHFGSSPPEAACDATSCGRQASCLGPDAQRGVGSVAHDDFSLSILEYGYQSRDSGLEFTLAMAQLAEECGYSRLWFTEHHHENIQIAAPELVIATVAAQTRRIRVGSAGILLHYYSPWKVAEVFHTLATLFSGRIDLGIARRQGLSMTRAKPAPPSAVFDH